MMGGGRVQEFAGPTFPSPGNMCRFLPADSGFYPACQKNQRRQRHTAATIIQNTHFFHTGRASMKSYERELLSSSLLNSFRRMRLMISFRILLLHVHGRKI